MGDFLAQNWGTSVVVAVVIAVMSAIVIARIRARKQGKSGCGCGCSGCAMRESCHPSTPENKK